MATVELRQDSFDASSVPTMEMEVNSSQFSAFRVAGIYLFAGIVWIAVSDSSLAGLGGLTSAGLITSVAKGMIFVFLSTGLVFWLCRREIRNTARTMALLRIVVEGTTDVVFVKDCAGRYLLINTAGAQYLGRSVAEVIGRDDRELFGGIQGEQLMRTDQEILAGGAAITVEETLNSAGGSRIYQSTKAPYFDASGAVTGLMGVSRNITDRAQVESALRETEAKLREAQRIARLGSWSWEPSTDQVWWSDAEFELFGVDPKKVHPSFEAFLALLHPEDRAVAKARVVGMHSGANNFADDMRVIRDDGSCIWIHSRARATRNEMGEIVRVEGTDQDVTMQRLAREALSESERRFRLALESAGAVAFMWDIPSDSVTRYYSTEPALPVTAERVGTLNEVRARVHPDDLDSFNASLSACLAEGTDYFNEYRVVRADGSTASLEDYGFLDRDTDGSPLSLTGMVRDVTERVVATEALRSSEARYRQLVDMLPTAIFVHTGNAILFGNPAFQRLMGVEDHNELMKHSPYDFLHPTYHDLFRHWQEKIAQTQAAVPGCEMLGVRCDGRSVPLHVVAAPVEGYGVPATVVALSDLTERERTAALLRSVLDSVGDSILTMDSGDIITSANSATERLFGYSESDLCGDNVSVLVHLPDLQQNKSSEANLLHLRASELIGVGREVTCQRKDGSPFPAELTISEFLRDGERAFTWVLRDITARRQLEAQFRQSQKMEAVGRLAGGVAHDFNNLLTVINVYSEVLLSGLSAGDPSYGPLAAIHDAGDRAARLTKQLLSFSRKSINEPRLVDLNNLVTESSKLLRRLIGEDVVLSVSLASTPVQVVIDPGQMEQVLMNLALNARDAMPTGGRLTIETDIEDLGTGMEQPQSNAPLGLYVSLKVTDTGCGMSAEIKEKIFEPFYTTKEVGKGTGLGLSVVHGVVQQSGGTIAVESMVGVGTSFKILLPAVTNYAQESKLGETQKAPRGTETIVLVEDEDAVRTVVRVALESQGYTVLAASGGKEALRLLREHADRVDLLVTDVIMPGMSGSDLVAAARESQPRLRVLYMSGYTDDAMDRHGLQKSPDQLLQKPFTPLSLARKVRALLDQSE